MCTCKQKFKVPAGPPGNFNYVFSCTDSDGNSKEIKETSGNDPEAIRLALLDCESSRLAIGVDHLNSFSVRMSNDADMVSNYLTLQCYLQYDDDYFYIFPNPCKKSMHTAPKQDVRIFERTSCVNCSEGSIKSLYTITVDLSAVDIKIQNEKGVVAQELPYEIRFDANTLNVKIDFKANGEGMISFNGNSYPCLGKKDLQYPKDLTITPADKYPQKYSNELQVMMYYALLIWGRRGIYIYWGDDTLATNGGPSQGCIHMEKPQVLDLFNWITQNTCIQISYPW